MTAEVIIMNKSIAALAADSAATVSASILSQSHEEQYFKGVNKIFQLSNQHPVGIMIYGTSTVHGVPWEILIKDFRDSSESQNFDTVKECAENFFRHVANHDLFYPEFLDRATINNLFVQILELMQYVYKSHEYEKYEGNDNSLILAMSEIKSDILSQYDINENSAKIRRYTEKYKSLVLSEFESSSIEEDIKKFVIGNFDALFDFAVLWEFSALENSKYHAASGLVFAGFGKTEYFPSYLNYDFYGYLIEAFEYKLSAERKMDAESVGWIEQFAISETGESFINGVSKPAYDAAVFEYMKSAISLLEKLGHEINSDHIKKVFEARKQFADNWTDNIFENNVRKIRQVIQSMSIQEIASLAETLIQMESLKEKITRPSESVGGPVDVAIISKFDGFIWIKRKHYFNQDLNPRYFDRIKGYNTTSQGGGSNNERK